MDVREKSALCDLRAFAVQITEKRDSPQRREDRKEKKQENVRRKAGGLKAEVTVVYSVTG